MQKALNYISIRNVSNTYIIETEDYYG